MIVEDDCSGDAERSMLEKLEKAFPGKALLKEKQVSSFIGYSVKWLQNKRQEGQGIPFLKEDPTRPRSAVWYRPIDVVRWLMLMRKCESTSEY